MLSACDLTVCCCCFCCCQLLSCVQLFVIPWTITTRLHCPWDHPGKNTGVYCHFLLQGIFPTQGSNTVSCIAGEFFTTDPMGKPNLKVKNVESRALKSSDLDVGFSHNGEVYKCMHIHRHHLKFYIKTFNYSPLCPISSHRFYAVVLIPTIPHQQAATKLNRKQKIIVQKKLSLFFNSFNEIIEFISHGFYVKGNCLFLGLIFMFDMHIQTHNLNSDIKEALLKTFQEP